jgi:hypothetical protein
MASYLQDFQLNSYIGFPTSPVRSTFPDPFVLLDLLIFTIFCKEQATGYEVSHYVVLSVLLSLPSS